MSDFSCNQCGIVFANLQRCCNYGFCNFTESLRKHSTQRSYQTKAVLKQPCPLKAGRNIESYLSFITNNFLQVNYDKIIYLLFASSRNNERKTYMNRIVKSDVICNYTNKYWWYVCLFDVYFLITRMLRLLDSRPLRFLINKSTGGEGCQQI